MYGIKQTSDSHVCLIKHLHFYDSQMIHHKQTNIYTHTYSLSSYLFHIIIIIQNFIQNAWLGILS